MMMDIREIATVIKDLSPWAAIPLTAYIISPHIPAFLSKFPTRNGDKRLKDLEEFRAVAEGNHFTDLERLLKSDEQQWKEIEHIRAELKKQGEDIAYIRGQIGNGRRA